MRFFSFEAWIRLFAISDEEPESAIQNGLWREPGTRLRCVLRIRMSGRLLHQDICQRLQLPHAVNAVPW